MIDQQAAAAAAPGRSKPNVIVILADDMGWGDLGCYGATAVPTPNIDLLAAHGLRCANVHASSALCTPSRYSLLTGEYAWRGPLKSGVLGGHGPSILSPGKPTLASMMQTNGYSTAAIGKWHLGLQWHWLDGTNLDAFGSNPVFWPDLATDRGDQVDYTQPFMRGPLEYGFDRFFGIAGSLDMPPYCFLDQNRTLGVPDREKVHYLTAQRPGRQTADWEDDQVDVRFTLEATEWMRRQAEPATSFFLYLAPSAPHRPCVPPDFVRGRSSAGPRGDAVCLVDWMVGEVMKTLDELAIADNTLLIVTSDNGAPTRFPEDGDVVNHRPNGPWRGQKADIWDGGHREPFIARWPGHIPAGTTRDDLICLTDVFRSLASATGAQVPHAGAPDGIDVLPILTGSVERSAERVVVHHSGRGHFAARNDQWKLILSTGSGGFSNPKGTPYSAESQMGQLYDMVDDRTESINLWTERPDVVADMMTRLEALYGNNN